VPLTASSDLITLRDAYARIVARQRFRNAYDWYRRAAQRRGRIWLGEGQQLEGQKPITVAVEKVGRTWMVSSAELDAAFELLEAAGQELERITTDYDNRRLAAGPGARVRTSWGSYSVSEHFHFVRNNEDVYRHRSDGFWRCNACWAPATSVHDKPECHTCRDWGGCGSDCTLSGIRCDECGTSKEF
jgi:hypothetical protein